LKSHQEAIVLLHQAEAFEKIYREHKDHWLQTFIEAQKRLRAADIWLFTALCKKVGGRGSERL
jgi:hypothetical protein